jgi:hypothetical protein
MPSVIVKKPGFFTSLVSGFFSLLITCVICATGLGAYGIHVFDKKSGDLTALGGDLLQNLPTWPKWKASLPPVLADAVNDRPATDYRANLDVTVRLKDGKDRWGRRKAIIRVKNSGGETVSVLAMNFVLKDDDGAPVGDFVSYVATPIAIDDDWRGPILPGSVREFTRWVSENDKLSEIGYEITALRIVEPRTADAASVAHSD